MEARIDENLKAFLQSPVMIVVGSCDASSRPSVGRGIGARVTGGGGSVDVFISQWQWPQTISNLDRTRRIAVTFSRPSDYMTYQLKGAVQALSPLEDSDGSTIRHYLTEIDQALASVGLPAQVARGLLASSDLVRVRFAPDEIFIQTPGPTAGQPLGERHP